jgi:hypothetical protein
MDTTLHNTTDQTSVPLGIVAMPLTVSLSGVTPPRVRYHDAMARWNVEYKRGQKPDVITSMETTPLLLCTPSSSQTRN